MVEDNITGCSNINTGCSINSDSIFNVTPNLINFILKYNHFVQTFTFSYSGIRNIIFGLESHPVLFNRFTTIAKNSEILVLSSSIVTNLLSDYLKNNVF